MQPFFDLQDQLVCANPVVATADHYQPIDALQVRGNLGRVGAEGEALLKMAAQRVAIDGLVGDHTSDHGAGHHRRQVPNRVAPTRVLSRRHCDKISRLKQRAVGVGCNQRSRGTTLAGGLERKLRGVRAGVVRDPDRDATDRWVNRGLERLTSNGTAATMAKGVIELGRNCTRAVLACPAANDDDRLASGMGLLNGRSDFLETRNSNNRLRRSWFGVDHLLHQPRACVAQFRKPVLVPLWSAHTIESTPEGRRPRTFRNW